MDEDMDWIEKVEVAIKDGIRDVSRNLVKL